MLTGESGRELWLRRARHIGEILGLTLDDVDALPITVIDAVAPIAGESLRSTMVDALTEIQLALVIIDPLYTYYGSERGSSAGNVYDAGELLSSVSALTVEHGTALKVVSHFNRSGADTLSLSSITQAGSREWSETWVLLRHKKAADPENGVFIIEGSIGSRHGYGAEIIMRWDIGPFDMETLRHEGTPTFKVEPARALADKENPVEKAVRDFVRLHDAANDKPLTFSAIKLSKEIPGTNSTREGALLGLVEKGPIRVDQSYQHVNAAGVLGTRYDAYRYVFTPTLVADQGDQQMMFG